MEYLTSAWLAMDAASTTAEEAAAGSTNLVMVLFKALIAVYLMVGAIRGKGRLIHNEFPKCKPETYRLVMRLLCAFASIVILANSAFEFLADTAYGEALALTAAQYATINTVLWAIGLVAMLALIVVNIVLTDRKALEEARKKQEAARSGHGGGDRLRAAFVFDEEDEKDGAAAPKEGGGGSGSSQD